MTMARRREGLKWRGRGARLDGEVCRVDVDDVYTPNLVDWLAAESIHRVVMSLKRLMIERSNDAIDA